MNHREFTFRSRDQKFIGQIWEPDDHPKAVLCIVHGHGEHALRYARFSEFMVKEGLAVASFDNYGHGKTGGKKGHIPEYEAVMEAIDDFGVAIRKEFSETPRILMGHSMGGNFVSNYVLRFRPRVEGVILSSPWLRLAFKPAGVQVFLAQLMLKFWPSLTQSSRLDSKALSRDPEEVKRYEEDPLVHDKISPVLFMGCLDAGEWALSHAGEWNYPLLAIHGTADRITSHEATEAFVKAVKSEVQWNRLEGFYHETFNEPEPDRNEVMQMIADWITRLIEKKESTAQA